MIEIVKEWDYRGWAKNKTLSSSPDAHAHTQPDWNMTIITAINSVANKIGVEKGGYVMVVVPQHLRHVTYSILKFAMVHPSSRYQLDVHYVDSDMDVIDVNGYGIRILNYPQD